MCGHVGQRGDTRCAKSRLKPFCRKSLAGSHPACVLAGTHARSGHADSGIDRRSCYSVLQCATVRLMKIRTITQRELRNQSAAVLREVEAGRTIIVSRNGTPVGELRPIKRRRFVPRAAIADAAGRAARIDAGQFRADLDAVVDPHPND
jgi:prevent-host-death family protein